MRRQECNHKRSLYSAYFNAYVHAGRATGKGDLELRMPKGKDV